MVCYAFCDVIAKILQRGALLGSSARRIRTLYLSEPRPAFVQWWFDASTLLARGKAACLMVEPMPQYSCGFDIAV